MSLKSTLFPKELWEKPFISQAKEIKKNLRHFRRWRTAQDNILSPNIRCTFLLFKASAFLLIFCPINLPFRQVFKTWDFISTKCLKFLYLFISLLKNIHEKHQIKEQILLTFYPICFFIWTEDKITYSKS